MKTAECTFKATDAQYARFVKAADELGLSFAQVARALFERLANEVLPNKAYSRELTGTETLPMRTAIRLAMADIEAQKARAAYLARRRPYRKKAVQTEAPSTDRDTPTE